MEFRVAHRWSGGLTAVKLLYDVREIRICLTDECKVIHVIINCYLEDLV